MRYVTIEHLDGTTIDSRDFGFVVSRFHVPAPTIINKSENIEGLHGQIDFGASYAPRELELEGYFNGKTVAAYPLYRDRVFRMFGGLKSFYIIDSYQPWKRWLVRVDGDWDVDRLGRTAFGEVQMTLKTMKLPFAQTNATTLEPKVWKDNGWWWGAGISWGDENAYVFNTTSFTVKNFGDVPVDPRQSELVITFNGASSGLTITNETTGDVFQYYGTTGASDEIEINGIRPLKNGLSIISDTNLELITIDPGDNQFTVDGATGPFTITFGFRYLYL